MGMKGGCVWSVLPKGLAHSKSSIKSPRVRRPVLTYLLTHGPWPSRVAWLPLQRKEEDRLGWMMGD